MHTARARQIAIPVFAILLFTAFTTGELDGASRLGALGFDFDAYYQAATRMLAGQSIYDLSSDVIGRAGDFYYPPSFLLLIAPFTILPQSLAAIAWSILLVACTLLAIALMPVHRHVRWIVLLLVSVSTPFLDALGLGQIAPIQLLLIVVGWRWIDRSAILGAAVAVGAMMKIQPVLTLGWMALQRRVSGSYVALLLGGVSILVVDLIAGPRAWLDFVTQLQQVSNPVETPRSLNLAHLAYEAGVPQGTAAIIQMAMLVALAVSVVVAMRTGTVASSYFVIGVVAQLASPVLWDHYAVLLFVPVAWLLARGVGWIVIVPLTTSVFLLGASPAVVYPLGYLAVVAALLLEGRRAADEMAPTGVAPHHHRFDIVRLRKQATA